METNKKDRFILTIHPNEHIDACCFDEKTNSIRIPIKCDVEYVKAKVAKDGKV